MIQKRDGGPAGRGDVEETEGRDNLEKQVQAIDLSSGTTDKEIEELQTHHGVILIVCLITFLFKLPNFVEPV